MKNFHECSGQRVSKTMVSKLLHQHQCQRQMRVGLMLVQQCVSSLSSRHGLPQWRYWNCESEHNGTSHCGTQWNLSYRSLFQTSIFVLFAFACVFEHFMCVFIRLSKLLSAVVELLPGGVEVFSVHGYPLNALSILSLRISLIPLYTCHVDTFYSLCCHAKIVHGFLCHDAETFYGSSCFVTLHPTVRCVKLFFSSSLDVLTTELLTDAALCHVEVLSEHISPGIHTLRIKISSCDDFLKISFWICVIMVRSKFLHRIWIKLHVRGVRTYIRSTPIGILVEIIPR